MAGDFDRALEPLADLRLVSDYDELVSVLKGELKAGDQVVFMSNGGFGGARQKLTLELKGAAGA